MKKTFNKEDCLKWFKSPEVDPQTLRKLKLDAKNPNSIANQLKKQCDKYKENKVIKPKSLSSVSSESKSITKKQTVKVKESDINYIKEFAVHTERPYKAVEDLDKSMIDACPKNVFNKAYFQYFVGQYMSKRTNFKNLLLFYTVGTGKTCAAISIAESMLIGHNNFEEPPIIVILPRTLIKNFTNTIYDLHNKNINQCSEDIYKLNNFDSTLHLNQFIQQRYSIMTYAKFIKYDATIENKTIIIDEAHNLRNPSEVDDDEDINKDELCKIYSKVETAIKNGKNNRLILMSGTPMFNEASEIKDLLNLLLLNDGKPKINNLTNNLLAGLSSQYISYINSQNPFVYPIRIKHSDAKMRDLTPDGLIEVKLNNKQIIKDTENIMNNVKNMNIAYSPKQYFSKTEFKYKPFIDKTKVLDQTNISTYAPKIAKIIDYIKKTTGIAIIYSNYIEYGILQVALALEYIGYSRYVDSSFKDFNLLDDVSIKRKPKLKYAVITSENNQHISNTGSSKNIENILKLANSDSNIYGNELKLILITKKASEGLSFLNIREVHILDPWYHFNRHEQIIGRGFRRCSHIKLPLNLRNITVFVYCGYFEDKSNISADKHAYDIAISKLTKIRSYTSIIEENAFDNRINEKLNIFPRSLFNNVNPIKIITSQNLEVEYFLGNDKEYKEPIDKSLISDNNLRSENMFLSNRYSTIIKDMIEDTDYIPYEELLSKCNDKRYLDLAINNVIFPNKIGNYLLIFNNNGIQKITDHPDIVEQEIILDEPIVNKPKTPANNTNNIDKYEKGFKDFELLYKFLMYINNTNWDSIAISIIKNKTKYPKLYKVLSDKFIIVNDNYFDLFSTDKPLPLKNIDGNITKPMSYEEQKVKDKTYGIIGVAKKSKGVLSTNLVFKIISGNNKGIKCESQSGENLNKILDEKSNNKSDKCMKIAKKFYDENNLLIIPYIKMKK